MKIPLLVLFACLVLAPVKAEDLVWKTDYAAAKAEAAQTGKSLLLDFTGSDWCFFCKKLDAEVLSTDEFRTFAAQYVLVRLDFPRSKTLLDAEKSQNAALSRQFKVRGFPTLVVASADGTEQTRAVGYRPGSGAKAYLKSLAPNP